MTYQQVAEGLATRLATISGVNAFAYPAPNPPVPAAIVAPGPSEYDQTFRNSLTRISFVVRMLVGRADDDTAADSLYAYLDPTGSSSVKAAIEGDKTLGGVVDDACVTRHDTPGLFDYGGQPLLGVEFTVEVML